MTLARHIAIFAVALPLACGGLAPAGAATTEHGKAATDTGKADKQAKRTDTKKETKKKEIKENKTEAKKEATKELKADAKIDTTKTEHGAAARKRPVHVALPTVPRRISVVAPVAAAPTLGRVAVPTRPIVPLAPASSAMTSPLDLTAVKEAIQLVHRGRGEEATNIEKTITDPVARKLVEWIKIGRAHV